MKRCAWNKLESNQKYITYHDEEWGVASYDDAYLFEMFILESFHCGLSWALILNKREFFKEALDNFDAHKISQYDDVKIQALLENKNIVRNKAKILATIENAKAFLRVVEEFGTFSNYIWGFSNHQVCYYPFDAQTTKNELSDSVSKDLKKRGFKFMGSVTCFSYLEAIGVMNNHATYCFKYIQEGDRI